MKVRADWSHDCTWGVVPYVQESLQLLSNEESNEVIMNGAAWLYEKFLRDKYKDYDRRCLLAFWSPCEFTQKKDFYHFDDYEFFTDAVAQIPMENVLPYVLHSALFSDYADKHRFVYVPKGKKAKFIPNQVYDFPIG